MSSQREWIRQRLPPNFAVAKNGLNQSVDEAITSALADYSDKGDFAQKRYALADLYDIHASQYEFDSERVGDWQGQKELWTSRAKALRDMAANGSTSPGSFSFVTATFARSASDEYSAD